MCNVDTCRYENLPFGTGDQSKPRKGKTQGFSQKSQGISQEGNGSHDQQPVQFVVEDNSRRDPQILNQVQQKADNSTVVYAARAAVAVIVLVIDHVFVDPVGIVEVECRPIGVAASVHHTVAGIAVIVVFWKKEGGDRSEGDARKSYGFRPLGLSGGILIPVAWLGFLSRSCVGMLLLLLARKQWQILFFQPAFAAVASTSEINDGVC